MGNSLAFLSPSSSSNTPSSALSSPITTQHSLSSPHSESANDDGESFESYRKRKEELKKKQRRNQLEFSI